MLTSYSESFKTWIFAKNTNDSTTPIARLLDFVINPDSGIFEAIWVQSTTGVKLISPHDILEWNKDEIFIGEPDEILETHQLPRLQKTIEKEIPIIKAKVFTHKTKTYLGTVSDFAFDTISPRILSLTVDSGFWIFKHSKIIVKSRIKEITKNGILVEENQIKIKEKEIISTAEKIKKNLPEMDCQKKIKRKEAREK